MRIDAGLIACKSVISEMCIRDRSWSNNLTWRNFDLSVFFRGTFGFDVFNMRKYGMGPVSYTHLDVYKRQLPHSFQIVSI